MKKYWELAELENELLVKPLISIHIYKGCNLLNPGSPKSLSIPFDKLSWNLSRDRETSASNSAGDLHEYKTGERKTTVHKTVQYWFNGKIIKHKETNSEIF